MKKTKKYLKALTLIFSLSLVAVSQASAWGPERKTYTNESPAPYATFNSIENNVAVGDERNFVRVREIGSNAPYGDEIKVVPGKEYEVYIYYHNNAATNTNESGYGIATNVRVASAYPTKVTSGERGMISGIISWGYVTPDSSQPQSGKVWDEAYLTTDYNNVVMRYKTGSAVIHNSGAINGSVLPTNLFTEAGTLIGFNKLTGTLPGCAEYSGHITYTLVAEKTESSLDKQVSLDGKTWSNTVTTKPGNTVTYKVVFKNTGNTNLQNVIFKDTHDNGLLLVSGSTQIFDYEHQNGLKIDDIIDISGYNTGEAFAGDTIQVIYQAKVREGTDYCGKTLNNTISVRYNSADQQNSSASVVVQCDNPVIPDPEPTCATHPEMEGCSEIPETGPLEIVMAVVVLLGICGGIYYYVRTQKTLTKVTRKATGKYRANSKTSKTRKK